MLHKRILDYNMQLVSIRSQVGMDNCIFVDRELKYVRTRQQIRNFCHYQSYIKRGHDQS
jgi:hypothetical protein